MPFTLAHPAAVLPAARWASRRGLWAALVVGAMAPDFGYLVPGGYVHSRTHTPGSLVWFSLPAGLVVLWLYRAVIRPFVIGLAPPRWQARLTGLPGKPRARLLALAAAVLCGAATHWCIDALTHADGSIARHFPLMANPLFELWGTTIHPSRLLQHGCTLGGVAWLTFAIHRWARCRDAELDARGEAVLAAVPWPAWKKAVVCLLMLVPAIVAAVIAWHHLGTCSVKVAAGRGVVAGMGVLGLLLVAGGILRRIVESTLS